MCCVAEMNTHIYSNAYTNNPFVHINTFSSQLFSLTPTPLTADESTHSQTTPFSRSLPASSLSHQGESTWPNVVDRGGIESAGGAPPSAAAATSPPPHPHTRPPSTPSPTSAHHRSLLLTPLPTTRVVPPAPPLSPPPHALAAAVDRLRTPFPEPGGPCALVAFGRSRRRS